MSHNLIIFLNTHQICRKLDITGAYAKIGYFEREADLIFQDEVHGNLFEQVEGTIDLLSWGRGISKMTELCLAGGLPEPSYLVEGSDFCVIFKKNIYNTEYLESLGLNGRQVKAVLFAKEKGKITNSDYQTLNSISKRTATTELTELSSKFKILIKTGTSGSSIFYKIVGQKLGNMAVS